MSLHNHSQMSDGQLNIGELIHHLVSEYQVIAITDHDYLTYIHPLHVRGIRKKYLLLKGIEYSAAGFTHLLGLEPTILSGTSYEVWNSCRVKWICHPRLSGFTGESLEAFIGKIPPINGVEMFNSGILQVDDNLNALRGMNYYACDDLHERHQIKASWMEVEVDGLDKETIIEALIEGNYTICTSNNTRNPLKV